MTRAGGLPEGYAAIPRTTALIALTALLAIYLSSTIFRTLLRGFTFTSFETTQWALAFLLSIGGALRVARGDSGAVHAVALFSLICGVACYVVSFAFLESAGKRNRNFYSYSTFGFLLVFTGIRILASGTALALILSGLGLVCFGAGRQGRRMTLEWHGGVYIVLASLLSGLAAWAGAMLLSAGREWVSPEPGRLDRGGRRTGRLRAGTASETRRAVDRPAARPRCRSQLRLDRCRSRGRRDDRVFGLRAKRLLLPHSANGCADGPGDFSGMERRAMAEIRTRVARLPLHAADGVQAACTGLAAGRNARSVCFALAVRRRARSAAAHSTAGQKS